MPGYKVISDRVSSNVARHPIIVLGLSGTLLYFQAPYYKDVLSPTLPANGLYFVDHVVGNQPDLTMEDAAKW